MASEVFDVCVVGGGIVGLCVARQLLLEGLSVVLFERSSGVLCAASGRNSSILHCGFDARSECPLEQRLVQEGSALWRELIRKTPGMFAARQQGQYGGGLVVAWTEEEEKVLPTLLQKARANKCPEVQLLSKEQLQRFGVLHESARAGLWVPNEIVADSWIAGMFVFHQALEMGLKLRLNCAVWSVRQREEDKLLIINDSAVVARRLVNAAGTEADRVEAMRPGGPLCQFESRPRLGEFVVFECKDKPVDALPIIYPVPTERTKGVLIWQNLAGYLVVGPTARDVDSREVALDAVDERSCKDLENFARKKLNVVGKRVRKKKYFFPLFSFFLRMQCFAGSSVLWIEASDRACRLYCKSKRFLGDSGGNTKHRIYVIPCTW